MSEGPGEHSGRGRLIALLIGAAVLTGGCVVMQRAILFPGQSRSAAPNAIDRFPSFESIRLDTEFGPIEAWYQPAPGAGGDG